MSYIFLSKYYLCSQNWNHAQLFLSCPFETVKSQIYVTLPIHIYISPMSELRHLCMNKHIWICIPIWRLFPSYSLYIPSMHLLFLTSTLIYDAQCTNWPIALKSVVWYISKNYLTRNEPYLMTFQKIQKIRKLYSPDPDSGSGIRKIWDQFFS